nr:hypothetical protein [Tanacetum cinerariifolium]
MNMLNRNCKTAFAKPEFLKKAQRVNPCLYDIGCYNDNLALMLDPESDEMIHLDKESRSKIRVIPTTSISRPQLKSNQLKVRHMPNNSQGKMQQVEDHRRNFKFSVTACRVIPTTSISRPQLKSNQLKVSHMPYNSQGKMQQVEDHRRNFKFSVTSCSDSLNAKTSNVNFVCVTCEKCMFNDNHDMCVLHYQNGVNSRTKQPIAMPISNREPKRTVNLSVATSLKTIVASDSTNQKPRKTTRRLYEHVSKTCRWWYPKFTPSGYKWKPKYPIGNVNTNVSMPLGNAYKNANILEPMTP